MNSGWSGEFVKVEGLGNDFVLIDLRDLDDTDGPAALQALTSQAPPLCDRRLGVGADGLLLIGPGRPGRVATMTVINADGSRPEMCGNGLRCAALFMGPHDPSQALVVTTDAGDRTCRVDPARGWVEVEMGPARFEGHWRPAEADGLTFERWSMGNPHAVGFVGPDQNPESLARTLGPTLSTLPPGGTNVEFARVEPGGDVLLWVHERGCGVTQACGTGACATAAAAVRQGLVPPERPLTVHLPGGQLEIVVPADALLSVRMGGPARLVYRGHWTG